MIFRHLTPLLIQFSPFSLPLLCIESKKICEIWGQLNNFWAKELEIGPPKGHLTTLLRNAKLRESFIPYIACRRAGA